MGSNGFPRPWITVNEAMEKMEARDRRHRAVGPSHLRAVTENNFLKPDASNVSSAGDEPKDDKPKRAGSKDNPFDFE